MQQVVDRTIIGATGLGFSMSDSSAIQVELFSSGVLLDSISFSAEMVASLPNNYWFERVWSWSELVRVATTGARIANVSGSWVANPGFVFALPSVSSGNLLSWESSLSWETDYSLPSPLSTSGELVETELLPKISITEIHPGNDALPEYIELLFESVYSWQLTIVGAGNGPASKSLFVFALTWQLRVVGDPFSGHASIAHYIPIEFLSLTDGWEYLALYDLTGNMLDEIIYTGNETSRSRYRDGTWSLRADYPSPGFSDTIFQRISLPGAAVEKPEGKSSYYEDLYRKWKDRYYELKDQLAAFGIWVNQAGQAYNKSTSSQVELVSGSENFADLPDLLRSVLQIKRVLPDAEGKDEGNEQITIALLSWEQADLSMLKLVSNNKKTALQGSILFPGDEVTLKGTFNLVNKPACVSLQQENKLIDTFCYGQPKAGVRIGLTGDISEYVSSWEALWRMRDLSLTLSGTQACALFGDALFNCLSFKSVLDADMKAKYDKKLASLQEKYENKQRQYTWLQARYSKTKESLEMKRRKYYEQLKALRSSSKNKLAESALEIKIRKNYGQLLQSQLKSNRYLVWQNTDIAHITNLLEKNIEALESNESSLPIVLHGQTFTLWDLKKQYAFTADPGVVVDHLVAQGLWAISSTAAQQRHKRLEIWYLEE